MNIKRQYKLIITKRKITGRFHNMVARRVNGKKTVFCINKNVWDTMWPLCWAREEFLCEHFNETCCTNEQCPQKAAHDEYMVLKNQSQNRLKQKEK